MSTCSIMLLEGLKNSLYEVGHVAVASRPLAGSAASRPPCSPSHALVAAVDRKHSPDKILDVSIDIKARARPPARLRSDVGHRGDSFLAV